MGDAEKLVGMGDYPILEFDEAAEALLEPSRMLKPLEGMPERVVVCFFQEVIAGLVERHAARAIRHLRSELGTHPVYAMEVEGRPLAVFHPGVGAPLAAGILEEVIALGGRRFIACGGESVADAWGAGGVSQSMVGGAGVSGDAPGWVGGDLWGGGSGR